LPETQVKKRKRCRELGFTLVETLIVTALLSIVFTTVVLYYHTAYGLWEKGNSQAEVRQQARIALARLVSDLQQTKSLRYRPLNNKSWRELPAGFTLKLQEGYVLQLYIPEGTEGEQELEVHYYLSVSEEKELTLIRDTGGNNPIALDIVALELRLEEEGPLADIELVAAREGAEARLVTAAYLRNLRGGAD